MDDSSCQYFDDFGICDGNNTIQGAIDAASDGDIIYIPSGNYSEALVIDKSLSLNGETISGSAGVTLEVSGNTTGIIIMENTSNVQIDGLTIIGDNTTGSGITIQPGASNITISNNTISNILLPGGGNSSPLSYGILCWGNTTPVNPPTNINISNNNISNVLGSAISLGTNTANVTISGNDFSNIIPVALNATTYLAIGVQAELSDVLDINNNSYSNLLQANNLVSCTNTSIGNNTYSNSPLMLNSNYPHSVSFNDGPWWNIIYATSATDFYQAYYSDTTNTSYQSLVQGYAMAGAPIWSSLSSSNPGCNDPLACNYDAQALSDDGSCTYATSGLDCDGNCLADADGDGVCDEFEIAGCTDSEADNYDSNATDDDGSCIYIDNPCDFVPTGLNVNNIIHNRVTFNWDYGSSVYPSDYSIRFKPVDGSNWTVITMEGSAADSLPNSQTSRTRWFMQPGTTYEWNVRSRVLNGDNSIFCQSSWSSSSQFTTLNACPNMQNLSVSTEAIWATFSADVPSSGEVWQSRGKMREIGTNSFRYAFGDADGNINVTKGNFEASTDYEWHTKAWCTGNVDSEGNSDPMYHSGWGEFYPFTTQALCDKMPTNLTTVTANFSQTVITMSWDTPITGEPDHYFLHLTNLGTGQVFAWNNIPGTSNSKTKYNLSPGEYSWKIRGACGTNGTSWATPFSSPVNHTLGGAKLENRSVTSLQVYPNPSRDIFNISFKSDEKQTIIIKIVNTIGKEIYTEKLTEFVGEYTKVIDISSHPKGIYFFEITTPSEVTNKKIILQ